MKFPGQYCLGYLTEEFSGSSPPEFLSVYSLIADVFWALDPILYNLQEKWTFGESTTPRRCAFCGKTESDGATFKSVSHLVPENLGNKRLVSLEECDVCNCTYSNCEAHLGELLLVERIFAGSRGKSGPASTKSAQDVSLQGQGTGQPVRILVDATQSPIRQLNSNTIEIPIDFDGVRPVLAIRSLLRSTWLLLPQTLRQSLSYIRSVATGEEIRYPLEYLTVFSPGIPPQFGRLRVWSSGAKPQVGLSSLPPLVVTMSLFNTTIIWRAPFEGRNVTGPLPPLPTYDGTMLANINRLSITADEPASGQHRYAVHFGSKRVPTDSDIELKTKPSPLSELRRSRDIRIAIAPSGSAAKWIPATWQLKKVSGDLLRVSLAIIRAPSHGIQMRMSEPDSTKIGMNFDFNGFGIGSKEALVGAQFCLSFCQPPTGSQLLIESESGVHLFPLERDGPDRGNVARLEQVVRQLQDLVSLERAVGRTVLVPGPEANLKLIELAALALRKQTPIRLKVAVNVILTLTDVDYARACNLTGPAEIPLGAEYPYAGVAELTEDVIGPIQVWAEVDDLATQLKTAKLEQKDGIFNVSVQVKSLRYVFERFLEGKPAADVAIGEKLS